MHIFLSYASPDRAAVEPVHLALTAQGRHEVFFDRASLPAGEAYDDRIREAIARADLFVFFVSPQAVDGGSYTLSELAMAARRWPHPGGRVLPVLIGDTPFEALPAWLKAVTLLVPTGSLAAEVADAVARLDAGHRRSRRKRIALAAAASAALLAAAAIAWQQRAAWFPAAGPAAEITARDGAPAVLIPAGSFVMGDDERSPRREVHLDAFYIDRFEVTLGRYAAFLAATGGVQPPDGWPGDAAATADLPVVGVGWDDANAYCRWAGKRLPTETEWEKAARGGDPRRYPWGNDAPTAAHVAATTSAGDAYAGGLSPVGSHPAGASAAGVHDLAGNAAEWVADWFAEGFARGSVRNPAGPAAGQDRVIRGGGWQDAGERLASARRWHAAPDTRAPDIGFRCARDVR